MDRMGVDWSNLNKDLIQLIGEKLDSYFDYLRFRSVSVWWASSLLNKPRTLEQQKYPYLLLPPDRSPHPHCSLLNPVDGKIVDHLELTGAGNKLWFRGCSQGWLIAIEEKGISMHLINTFPSADDDHHRLLPPISTFPDVLDYRPDRVGEEFQLRVRSKSTRSHRIAGFHEVSYFFIAKVVLSSPPTITNCIAMAIYGEYSDLAYCKYGDDRWTQVGGKAVELGLYLDILFYQDKFYAVNRRGEVVVIVISDLDSSPTATVAMQIATSPRKLLSLNILYLVVVDNNLLMLCRNLILHCRPKASEPESEEESEEEEEEEEEEDEEEEEEEEECEYICTTTGFDILFKLDLDLLNLDSSNNQPENWFANMSGILHNHVLFLGHNEALSFSSQSLSGCKCGHVYFSDNKVQSEEISTRGSDFGVFNFQNETIQPLHGYEHHQLLWPSPIWVMRLNHP